MIDGGTGAVTVADPDLPQLRVDELGLLRGDGVFETILVVDGRPRELGPHLDRLDRSAAMLQLPHPDRAAYQRAVDEVLDRWPTGELALRLVHTRGPESGGGPTGFALAGEVAPKVRVARETGIAVLTLDRGYHPDVVAAAPWLLLGAKTLSYAMNMAAIRHAEQQGADDVIFVAADGSVLEGPTSTVVVIHGRTLRTTPPTVGILPGTTQAALFRAAESAGLSAKVEPLTTADLFDADGVFLASSVRRVTRVHTINGESLVDSSELHGELASMYEGLYR